jgi:hypothetical protein
MRYKRDRAGRLVSTKANPGLLRALAERAGGSFFHIHCRGAFGDVLDAVARLDAEGGEPVIRRGPTALAACALAALLLEAWAFAFPRRRGATEAA